MRAVVSSPPASQLRSFKMGGRGSRGDADLRTIKDYAGGKNNNNNSFCAKLKQRHSGDVSN